MSEDFLIVPCAGCEKDFLLTDLEEFDGKFYCQFCYKELIDMGEMERRE